MLLSETHLRFVFKRISWDINWQMDAQSKIYGPQAVYPTPGATSDNLTCPTLIGYPESPQLYGMFSALNHKMLSFSFP